APAAVPEPEATVPEPETSGRRKHRRRRDAEPEPVHRSRSERIDEMFADQTWSTEVATWGEGARLAPDYDLEIDGRVHVSTLRALQAAMQPVEGGTYEAEVLYDFQDFRVLVAIDTVIALAEAYGVRSEIKPILPIPLGASELTTEEETVLYGGLVSGQRWEVEARGLDGIPVDPPDEPTLLISQVRDARGRVLYEAAPVPEWVAGSVTGVLTADILRHVVMSGTGRRAHRSTWAGEAEVPLGGKTGTTNDFRNAAFMGFAPVAGEEGFTLDAPYSLGVYVGYDDNRSMRSGGIVLAGASGALPTWTLTARGLGQAGLLGEAPAGLRMVETEGLGRVDAPGVSVLTWEGDAPPVTLSDVLAKVAGRPLDEDPEATE
ncbi:MAG: hypothetical protein QF464_21165, partial [Myxococcota bacterium]|nr:hypothetical protein [Myxococcota bacterium]